MAKVTGIGGVFFLSQGEGKALSSWYQKHLGMQAEEFGGVILNWEDDTAEVETGSDDTSGSSDDGAESTSDDADDADDADDDVDIDIHSPPPPRILEEAATEK